MQTDDKLLTIAQAVTEYRSRLPFLENEDKTWRAIRANHIPAVKIGRRVYLSTAKLDALAKGSAA